MKKLITILLAVLLVMGLAGCSSSVDPNAKSEGSLTYAEFAEKSNDYADVQIEGFITLMSYAQAYGNCNMFIQDGDGAYYVYRMPCTDEDAAKLVVGQKVIIKGQKTAWKDEVEIAEGTASYELVDAKYEFKPLDLTEKFDDATELYKHNNKLVQFKGLTVVADAMYNWDGSGAEGDDVYFTVSNGTTQYSFLVDSSEFAPGTKTYDTAKDLKAGDTVTLDAFLYWYEGPQAHVSGITK